MQKVNWGKKVNGETSSYKTKKDNIKLINRRISFEIGVLFIPQDCKSYGEKPIIYLVD